MHTTSRTSCEQLLTRKVASVATRGWGAVLASDVGCNCETENAVAKETGNVTLNKIVYILYNIHKVQDIRTTSMNLLKIFVWIIH